MDVVNLHHQSFQLLCCRSRLSISLSGVTPTLQLLPQERAITEARKVGDCRMIACLAQSRPLGLMPFDWLMLFTGTMLGGVIVLLF